MNYPTGKTPAQIKVGTQESGFKDGDIGYIDGYIQLPYGTPCAVFVREDGVIGLVMLDEITALFDS